MKKPIIALMYDFDKTLCTKDMQEYGFIPSLGMSSSAFWGEVRQLTDSQEMDNILAYMYKMVEKAKENVEAARERMAEAMKERKMHETLREKAFEAFLQEENHAESKAIDELTSYTYGQKNR